MRIKIKNVFVLMLILFRPLIAEAEICIVCYKEMHESELIQHLCCQHCFHSHCIGKWIKSKKSCPLCRRNLGLHSAYYKLVEHDQCVVYINEQQQEQQPIGHLQLQLQQQQQLQLQLQLQQQQQQEQLEFTIGEQQLLQQLQQLQLELIRLIQLQLER